MDVAVEERIGRLEARLQAFDDRQAIHDAQMRYCRGVDRGDKELISSVFHPGAIADHGSAVYTAETIADALEEIDRTLGGAMHLVGNNLIEIDGDVAVAEFYFVAFRQVDRGDETVLISRAARYVDRWERRDGNWKIAYRVVAGEWNRIDPILERMALRGEREAGRSGPNDPIYVIKTAAVGSLSAAADDDTNAPNP